MATEQQLQETVVRCVSIMVSYHDSEKTQKSRAMMTAEVETVAGRVSELDLGIRGSIEHILDPVEAELLNRYGHEAGVRINDEFVHTFESTRSMWDIPGPVGGVLGP